MEGKVKKASIGMLDVKLDKRNRSVMPIGEGEWLGLDLMEQEWAGNQGTFSLSKATNGIKPAVLIADDMKDNF